MIAALKNRINELEREDQDWKNKIVNAWNNEEDARADLKPSLKPHKVDIGDDRSDVRSVASEAKSVASERSQSKYFTDIFDPNREYPRTEK
jgi:hypothetical protein